MKFKCRCLAHFLKCVKVPPEKRMENAVRRFISGKDSQMWGEDTHTPLCPPEQVHLTFFCAPQWDTFVLMMVCPHVWHFLNSSIKQPSFTIVCDWLCSFSLLSDCDAVVQLSSVSFWTFSFRQSADDTLQNFWRGSATGGRGRERLTGSEGIWNKRDKDLIT